VLRVITVIGAVVLWRRGLRLTALWWAVTMIVSGAIAIVVREIVARPRPHWPGSGPVVDGYTYPSGHATSAAVFAGCCAVVLWPHLGRAGRALTVAAGLLFLVAVGGSRLVLGVHSIGDVLAAWALAACLLLAMIALGATPAVRRRVPARSPGSGKTSHRLPARS
jgi:membrane-associated phospholipid phosphatase